MERLKISELARRSGVPVATLKHYVREGLITAAEKTGRTMCWYHPAVVERVKAIKELQARQFLPLDVIRETLDRESAAADDLAAAEAIAKVLAKHSGRRSRTRDEVLARGANPRELAWLQAAGLATPSGPEQRYSGDDLALLVTLASARRAGLAAEMLPFAILDRYLGAIRALVAAELDMFRAGVFPRARPDDLERLTTSATQLSERLVILLRRKLLLPTLARLAHDQAQDLDHARSDSTPPKRTDRTRSARTRRARVQRQPAVSGRQRR